MMAQSLEIFLGVSTFVCRIAIISRLLYIGSERRTHVPKMATKISLTNHILFSKARHYKGESRFPTDSATAIWPSFTNSGHISSYDI